MISWRLTSISTSLVAARLILFPLGGLVSERLLTAEEVAELLSVPDALEDRMLGVADES